MARDSQKSLRNEIIYEVFPRNHSQEGTLRAIIPDLQRIRNLGTTTLWLMPIHSIGEVNRKGKVGSPYAISDYRAVHPDLGTEEDLRALADAAHALDMKLMIDVVYNHTAHDSVLFAEHPDWFYRNSRGEAGNRFGDWYDVIDLDYSNPELHDYLIDSLLKWVKLGVDGFRCDVATFVPLDFWEKARNAVAALQPHTIWLGESVQPDDILEMRAGGFPVCADSELFHAFDMLYEYDIYAFWQKYLKGAADLEYFAEKLREQEYIFPDNYCKLRFTENHDFPRTTSFIPEERQVKNWLALRFFNRGAMLLYAGQEYGHEHLPDLFNYDPIDREHRPLDLTDFIRKLGEIHKHPLRSTAPLEIICPDKNTLVMSYRGQTTLSGIFHLKTLANAVEETTTETIPVPLADGQYIDLLHKASVTVSAGRIPAAASPCIIEH